MFPPLLPIIYMHSGKMTELGCWGTSSKPPKLIVGDVDKYVVQYCVFLKEILYNPGPSQVSAHAHNLRIKLSYCSTSAPLQHASQLRLIHVTSCYSWFFLRISCMVPHWLGRLVFQQSNLMP